MSSEMLTVQFDSSELKLIAKYAKAHGCTPSEYVRRCTFECLEDELDVQDLGKPQAKHEEPPTTYSLEELMEALETL